MLQAILTALILSAAVFYAGWRLYKVLRHSADPCAGCKGCALREERRRSKNFSQASCPERQK